jgi:hypothetical protein
MLQEQQHLLCLHIDGHLQEWPVMWRSEDYLLQLQTIWDILDVTIYLGLAALMQKRLPSRFLFRQQYLEYLRGFFHPLI